MKAKHIWIVLVLFLLFSFSIWRLFLYKDEIVPQGTVTVFLHLYSDTQKQNISLLLDEFQSFYPDIKIVPVIEPYQDMRRKLYASLDSNSDDLVAVSVLSGQDMEQLLNEKSSSPWISYAWKLYYNKQRLHDLGYDEESLNEISSLGLESFIAEFKNTIPADQTLFALGTSFYIPWIMWLQHLQLLETNGHQPKGYTIPEWEDGLKLWASIMDAGYFNSDYHENNMAYSQLAITEGSALFVLSDSTIFSTYPPAGRSELASIPFPGSATQGWEVGSNFYLEKITGGSTSDSTLLAAEMIIDYLKSEGVSQRFLKQTGILLLPENDRAVINEIPAMTHQSMDLALQDLLKYLD